MHLEVHKANFKRLMVQKGDFSVQRVLNKSIGRLRIYNAYIASRLLT